VSVGSDIRGAVKAAVSGLVLAGTPGVQERKRPRYDTNDPPAGVICVSGIDLTAEPLTAEDAFAVAGKYGVAVTAIRPNAAAEQAGVSVENWIEVIRLALYKPNPLPSVSAVTDVDLSPRPWFNPAGLDKNYDWAQLALVFWTREARV
jgi:hypothetical protein